MQIEIVKKEKATKILEAETQEIQRHLQSLSGNRFLYCHN